MIKKLVLPVVLLLISAVTAAAVATSVVKEGVVDIKTVVRTFFRESKQFRDQQATADELNKKMASVQRDIADLQDQKAAVDSRDAAALSRLDRQIKERQDTLQYYKATDLPRIEAMMSSLVVNDAFLRNLLAAVRKVAEKEGLSIVKKLSDDYLYVSPEVDITDKVISSMRSNEAALSR